MESLDDIKVYSPLCHLDPNQIRDKKYKGEIESDEDNEYPDIAVTVRPLIARLCILQHEKESAFDQSRRLTV